MVKISSIAAEIQSVAAFMKEYDAKIAETSEKSEQAREQGHIVLPRAIILTQQVYPIYCGKRFGSVRWHFEHQILWSAKLDGVKQNKKSDADEAMQNPADSDTCDALHPTDGIAIKTETNSAIAHALKIKVTDDQIDKKDNEENHIIPIFDYKTKCAVDKLIKYADKKEENDNNIDTDIKITASELKSSDDLEKQGYQKGNERSEILDECDTTSEHKKTDTCDAISKHERTDVGHTIENNDITTLLTATSAKFKGQTITDQAINQLAKGLNEDKQERCATDVRLDGAAMSEPKCNNASGDITIAHVNNNPSDKEGNFTAFATSSIRTQSTATQKHDTFDIVLKLQNEDFQQVLNTDPACANQCNQTDFLKINKQSHEEKTHKVRNLEAHKKKRKRKKRIKTRQSYIDGNVDNLQNLTSASNVDDDKQTTYYIENNRTNISSQLLANNSNTSHSLTPTTTEYSSNNLQPLETCQTPVIQNVSVSAESHDECISNTIDSNVQANVIENDEKNLINKQAMEYRIRNVHAPNTIADTNAGHDNITFGEITSNNAKNESATKVHESICFPKSIKTDDVSNKLEDISCIEKADNKTIFKPSISVTDFQHNQEVSDNIADSDIVNLLPPGTKDATKRKHRSKNCCKHHNKTRQKTKQEFLDSKSYSDTVKITESAKFSSVDNFKANNIARIPLTSLKGILTNQAKCADITEQNGDKPQELPKYVRHNPTVVAMLLKANHFHQIKTHLAIQIKRPCIMTLCPSKKMACQCPKHCHEKPKLYITHEDFKMQSTATNIKEDIVNDKGMYSSFRFEEAYIKSKLEDNLNFVSTEYVQALNVALKTITVMTGAVEMYTNLDQAVSVTSISLHYMYPHSIMSFANFSHDAAKGTVVSSFKQSEDAINTACKGINSYDDNVTWTSNSTQRQALRTDNVAFYTTPLYLKYTEYLVAIDTTPEQTIYTANVLINSRHQQAQTALNKVHKCTHRNKVDAFTPQMDTTSEQEDDFVNEYIEYTLKKLAHTISPFHITYKDTEVDVNVSVDASIKPTGDGKYVVRNKVTKTGKETQAVEVNNTVKGVKNEDNTATKYILNINDDSSEFPPVHTACKQSEDAADETLLDIRIHYEATANVSIYITPQVTRHVVHAAIHVINNDYVDESSETPVKEMSNLDENGAILAMTYKQVERIENNIVSEHDAENGMNYAGPPANVKHKRKKFHDKLCKSIKSTVYPAENKMHFVNNSTPKLLSDDDDKSEINNKNDETRFSVNDTKHVGRAKKLKTNIKSDTCEHDMNILYSSTSNNVENHSHEVTAFNVQTVTALDIANNFKSKLITDLSNITFQIFQECVPGNTKISPSVTYKQIGENVNAIIKILRKNAEDNLHALHSATLKLAMDMLQVLINTTDKPHADNVERNPKEAFAVRLRSFHACNVTTSFVLKLITNILRVALKIRHDTAPEAAEVSCSTTYKEIEDNVNSAMNLQLRNVENNVYAGLQSNTHNPTKDILQNIINTIYIQSTERTYIEYLAVGDIDDAAEIDVCPVQYLEKEECTVFYDNDDDGGGILRVYADSEIQNIITSDQIKAMAADAQNGRTSTGFDSFRCLDPNLNFDKYVSSFVNKN